MERNTKSAGAGTVDVISSAITQIGYDEASRRLFVTFIGGRTYAYFDVPRETYVDFARSASKGEFFNLHIRDCYRHERHTRP